MADLEYLIALKLDSKGVVSGARPIDGALGKIDKRARSVDQAFGMMKRQLLGFVTAYLGTRAIQQAVRDLAMFEAGLIGVGKTANIEGGRLEALGTRIDQMSRRIPVASGELLGIAQAAGQLGVQGSDNILRFTETVARLGSASDLAGEEGATALARILNVTGESVETVDVLASVIVALGNNFAATERQIAHHTGEVARATAVYDLGSAQAAAFGTTLAAFGVRAELSGSAVGRSFRTIEDAVKSGGEKLEALARVSRTSAEEVSAAWGENPVEAFGLFLQGLREVIDEKGNVAAALETIGLKGEEILKVIPVLAKEYDSLAKALGLAADEQANTTALMTESEKAFASFQSQMQLLSNQAESARRLFAAGLAPAIKEAADRARDWVSENRDEIQEWGETAGKALSLVVDLLLVIVKNIDLLVIALKIWIGVKLATWASTATFHLLEMAKAIKAGYGQLVLMNSAQGLRGLLGLPVAKVMSNWVLGIGGVTAAILALGFGLNELIERWKEITDEQIKADIQASKIEGTYLELWNAARRSFTVSEDLYERASKAAEDARDRVAELRNEVDKYYRDTAKGGVGLRPELRGVDAPAIKPEALQEAERELAKMERTAANLEATLQGVAVAAEEAAGDGGGGGGGGGVGGLSDRLLDLRDGLAKTVEQLQLLKDARGSEEFELIEAAIAAGIDPTTELTDEFRDLLTQIIRLQEEMDALDSMDEVIRKLHVSNREAMEEENARWAEDFQRQLQNSLAIGLDPKIVQQLLEKAKVDAAARELANDFEKIWNNMLEGVQRSFATFFEESIRGVVELFRGGTFEIKDLFESLWQSVLDMAIRAASEAAAAWAAQKFAVNFTDGATGGGLSWGSILKGAKGLFGGGGGGSVPYGPTPSGGNIASTSSGGGLAAVGIAFAAFFAAVELNEAKHRHGYGTLGAFEVSGGERYRGGFRGQRGSGANEVFDVIEEVLDSIEELTRGVVEDLPELALRIRRDGEGVRVYIADQFLGWFKTMEEALDAGLRHALRGATLSGVEEEIQLALQAPAESLEDLMQRLQTVQAGLDLNLDPLVAEIRSTTGELDNFRDVFESIGADTRRFNENEIAAWQEWRDTVTGRERTHEEELEIQRGRARLWNAEKALRLAELEARLAAHDAEKGLVRGQAYLDLIRIEMQHASLDAQREGLRAQGEIWSAEERASIQHTENMGAIVGASAAVADAQGDALREMIDSLKALPDIDMSEIRLSGGGGGRRRQREADRDRLRGILDDFDRGQLSGMAAGLAEINLRFEENLLLAHEDAELIERVNDMRAREIDLLREQLRLEVREHVPELQLGGVGVGGEAFNTDTGEWGERAQDIADWADRVAEENQLLLEETGEAAVETWEIVAAEANRMRGLVEEAIGSLGLPMESTREQFDRLGETLRFLEQQTNAGVLSQRRYGDVIQQVADQQFLALGDALMGFLDRYYGDVEGFEDFRRRLEETRFRLELANLKLQFELVKDLGLLTAETVQFIEETFDWIDGNMPEFPSLTIGGAGGGFPTSSGGGGGVPTDTERDRARDLLDRYLLDQMDPLSRALHQLEEDFQLIRQQLGNTAEVQAAYAAALERIMRQHLEGIERLQQSMFLGSASPLTERQQLEQAGQLFNQAVARFEAGDLSVIAEIPQIVQQYLAAAQEFFPTGSAAYQNIFALVNEFLNEVLAVGNLPGMQVPSPAAPGGGAQGAVYQPQPLAPVPAPGNAGESTQGLQVARDSRDELSRIERAAAASLREQRETNRILRRRETESHAA